MTWLGVPVLDWVLLVFVLGLGVEAYLTTREQPEEASRTVPDAVPDGSSEPQNPET